MGEDRAGAATITPIESSSRAKKSCAITSQIFRSDREAEDRVTNLPRQQTRVDIEPIVVLKQNAFTMPRRPLEFRIVLASPSDLYDARKIVFEALAELNRTLESRNLAVRALGWEEYASPGVAADPQTLITQQVLKEFDILIALFGSKLGTPTSSGRTGTMDEVERALSDTSNPFEEHRVQIYFLDKFEGFGKVDADDFAAVLKYRGELSKRGVLYYAFKTVEELSREVRVNVSRAIQHYLTAAPTSEAESGVGDNGNGSTEDSAAGLPTLSDGSPIVSREEVGLLDFIEKVESSFESATNSMNKMTRLIEEIGSETQTQTARFEVVMSSDSSAAAKKKFVNEFAEFLKQRAAQIKPLVDDASINFAAAIEALIGAFVIGREQSSQEEYVQARSNFLELSENILIILSDTRKQVSALAETLRTFPRITIQFNQARRQLLEAVEAWIRLLEDAEEGLLKFTAES